MPPCGNGAYETILNRGSYSSSTFFESGGSGEPDTKSGAAELHNHRMGDALLIETFLLTARNVRVHDVEKMDCVNAGLSDAIACIIMKEGVDEVYSWIGF